jgi:hypothetical protein
VKVKVTGTWKRDNTFQGDLDMIKYLARQPEGSVYGIVALTRLNMSGARWTSDEGDRVRQADGGAFTVVMDVPSKSGRTPALSVQGRARVRLEEFLEDSSCTPPSNRPVLRSGHGCIQERTRGDTSEGSQVAGQGLGGVSDRPPPEARTSDRVLPPEHDREGRRGDARAGRRFIGGHRG